MIPFFCLSILLRSWLSLIIRFQNGMYILLDPFDGSKPSPGSSILFVKPVSFFLQPAFFFEQIFS